MVTIKTANGICKVKPAYCEVTGVMLGWVQVTCQVFTPAMVSFDVVSRDGEVLLDTSDINTF